MLFDLNGFLNHIVDNKEGKQALTGHHKVVSHRHIADQFDSTEVPAWDGATSSWELNEQSTSSKEEYYYKSNK